MARIRNDHRGTNNSNGTTPIRSTPISKKSEKWQTLRGWVTITEKDDTDIENWAKRRREAKDRIGTSSCRATNGVIWPELTPYCCSIEDVAAFKEHSLCEALHPDLGHRKNVGSQRKNDNRAGNSQANDRAEAEGGGSAKGSPDGDTVNGCSGHAEADERRDTGNGKRDSNFAASTPNDNRHSLDPGDRRQDGQRDGQDPGECQDPKELGNPDNSTKDESANGASCDAGDQTEDSPDNTQSSNGSQRGNGSRTIKLSYTQSNITLRNPYYSVDRSDGSTERHRFRPWIINPGDSGTFERAICHSSEDCTIFVDKLNSKQRTVSAYSESDVTRTDPDKNESEKFSQRLEDVSTFNSTPAPSSDSPIVGDGEPNSCRTKSDQQEGRRSGSSSRQVSLVLKKVSIQDANLPDDSNKPRPVATPVAPRSANRRQHINGFVTKNSMSPTQHMVPLGELLPAVEHNIKTRMFGTKNEYEIDEEVYVLDRDTAGSKERPLSYEDSLVMMREGMEMIKLKERQPSILGPPAFRPHPNKTPLHRAKENSTKRIYGQLNYTGNICYSDINKLRWKSSSGTLYSGNKNVSDSEGETKSAPAPASPDQPAEPPACPYRSHFYGFTTAESCPDSLSAALIKAGIDPVNNLYQLSKRRKPPPGRPLGDYTAYQMTSVNTLTAAQTSSDAVTSQLTDADLGHIRVKVGTRMAEVIRRRARGVDLHNDAKH